GLGHFETTSMNMTWDESGDKTISGEAPVEVSYPGLELYGENGFVGKIEDGLGLRLITLKPPVVVALDQERSQGMLGLGRGGGRRPVSEAKTYLLGSGPLTIDRHRNQVIFEGRVIIFRAPAQGLSPAPEVPESYLESESLVLHLRRETMEVVRATARRGEQPVRVHLKKEYRIEGNLLEWIEGNAEAVLSGEVRIFGPPGEFRAMRARLYPDENRCVLEQGVTGRLYAKAFEELEGSRQAHQLSSDWSLVAERAVIDYVPDDPSGRQGSRLSRFEAYSEQPNGVIITEDHPSGSQLYGSILTYEGEKEVLLVKGHPEQPSVRPYFQEGRSLIRSNQIQLQLRQRQVLFSGDVESRIYELPVADNTEAPAWLQERKRDDYIDCVCERLQLSWDLERRLKEIRAWQGKHPLVFKNVAEDAYRLKGEELSWQRESQRVVLSGEPGNQHLYMGESLHIRAGILRFNMDAWTVEAEEQVRVEVDKLALMKRLPGSEASQVIIESAHLQVQLSDPQQQQDSEDPTVVAARAWSKDPGRVRVSDGTFTCEGEELRWDAESGTLRMQGNQGQRLIYQEAGEIDEITAQKITLFRDAHRAILDGDVKGQIRQHSTNFTRRGSREKDWVWDLGAGHVEVVFSASTIQSRPEKSSTDSKNRRPFTIELLRAYDGVTLENRAAGLLFRGSACLWEKATQRLHVYSPDGQGVQTLYHGPPRKRDEIVSREISLVRVPGKFPSAGDRLMVFFQSVLRATFHVREPERSAAIPESFELEAENLLLNIDLAAHGPHEPDSGASAAMIREGYAWEEVTFRGGDYKLLSETAYLDSANSSVTFTGGPGKRPQLLQGEGKISGTTVVVKRSKNGSFQLTTRGG
ncbi:MAG: hypothetical protein V3T77_07725, partial [Planctomycetota bacterium]